MALRLTPSSLAPAEPALTHTGVGPLAEARRLVERAAAALRGGSTKDYLAVFDEADSIAEPQTRYLARKLLLEQGFMFGKNVDDRRATEILLAMAHAVVGVLDQDPAEPLLLNYAGVIFYELWSLDAARAMFVAAQRLDPELPHLHRNLDGVRQRKRAQGNGHRALHASLRDISRRATQLAGRAKPVEGMRLSLCMIVRDEEEMLPRCLEAAAPAVDEIVIVDTGSQDRTIEIARSFGATVIEREWTGSFSDARNASLDAATGDWLLYLDADEVLVSADVDKLRGLRGHTWREACFFDETNYTGKDEHGIAVVHSALRMFRNRPEYRFSGRLHEQIAHHLPAFVPERLHYSGVRLEHFGYLGTVRDAKDKSRRNLELLEAQKREDAKDPFLHFNLGSEYHALGELTAALQEFEQAWRLIDADPSTSYQFVPSLVGRHAAVLRGTARHEELLERTPGWLDRFPGFTDLVYHQGCAAHAIGRTEEAIAHFEKCMSMGDAPSRYTALHGAGTFLPRIALASIQLDRGDGEPALKLLRWCIENNPSFSDVVFPYASAMLRCGIDADAVIADVERRLPELTSGGRFLLGTALFEAGAAAPAETQFDAVLKCHPRSGSARVALTEALLYQRRYREGAAIAAEFPEDDPLATVAVRSELFGWLLDGDAQAAESAFDRATRACLPAPEQALYRAWIGRLRGDAPAQTVPVGAAPLLQLQLESLLRVQDFESFETVLGLLGSCELPLRERRELLAATYLHRGFLKSAAREWMAVCQEQPDARALVGLALVARGNGQHDTATSFAVEALRLDPTDEVAQALAAAVPQAVAA